MTMARVPLWLASVLACVHTLACTHTLEVRSEPPGAEVLLDGEPVGQTPLTLERQTSHADVRTLVVRHGDEEARLALLEDGWAFEPILAGFGAMGGLLLAGALTTTIGYATMLGSLLFVTTVGTPGLAGLVVGGVLLYGGILVASSAIYAPFLAVGELSRRGPDRVDVDFERARVRTSPRGHAAPLVGVSEGYRPLDWSGDVE